MPCCERCGENFPLKEGQGFRMGLLTTLRHAPLWVQELFGAAGFLCGNCYHDLVDEEEKHA